MAPAANIRGTGNSGQTRQRAGVAELVDAADSKSAVLTDMSVRVRPPAPWLFTPQPPSDAFPGAAAMGSAPGLGQPVGLAVLRTGSSLGCGDC